MSEKTNTDPPRFPHQRLTIRVDGAEREIGRITHHPDTDEGWRWQLRMSIGKASFHGFFRTDDEAMKAAYGSLKTLLAVNEVGNVIDVINEHAGKPDDSG